VIVFGYTAFHGERKRPMSGLFFLKFHNTLHDEKQMYIKLITRR
jgi:hypothetical protein